MTDQEQYFYPNRWPRIILESTEEFEHKSYPDPLVALQLLRYMVRFWERQAKDNSPLEPIIPLVIYHGEKAWHSPTDFLALLDSPEGLRPYLPAFRYHLSDFSHLSDEAIRGEIWLRVSLATLRAIFNPRLRDEIDNGRSIEIPPCFHV